MAETRVFKDAHTFLWAFLELVERIYLKFHQAQEFVYLYVLVQHLGTVDVCRPVRPLNLKQCRRLTVAPEMWG